MLPRILVVESDASARERLRSWLEVDGLHVVECGGPTAPEYTCPAGFLAHCPLTSEADVIVLNLWLESDTVLAGTPAGSVLLYYLSMDKPIVALTDGSDALIPAPQEGIAVLRRPPERTQLLRAVRGLLVERTVS
jgi:CheY-like chemotaxis protein